MVTKTCENGPFGVAQVAGSLIITLTLAVPAVTVPFMLLQAAMKRAATVRKHAAIASGKGLRNETACLSSIQFLQKLLSTYEGPRRANQTRGRNRRDSETGYLSD